MVTRLLELTWVSQLFIHFLTRRLTRSPFYDGTVTLLAGPIFLHINTLERLSLTFTSNGKREVVPRDQVSNLLVVYCSLFLQIN